jgi:thiol-disulfide isomerase/thioredoxin
MRAKPKEIDEEMRRRSQGALREFNGLPPAPRILKRNPTRASCTSRQHHHQDPEARGWDSFRGCVQATPTVDVGTLLKKGPVIVTFYRGGWCPYCNLELRAYQQILPEITAAGASLVAISPEKPDDTVSTAEKNALTFEVLAM